MELVKCSYETRLNGKFNFPSDRDLWLWCGFAIPVILCPVLLAGVKRTEYMCITNRQQLGQEERGGYQFRWAIGPCACQVPSDGGVYSLPCHLARDVLCGTKEMPVLAFKTVAWSNYLPHS